MPNTDVESIPIKVAKVKLIAIRVDAGGYIVYVFKNIFPKDNEDKFIMCTRFPNWNCCELQLGDIGYVKVQKVEAGKNSWYDSEQQKLVPYNYSGIHFLDFVYEKPKEDIVMT